MYKLLLVFIAFALFSCNQESKVKIEKQPEITKTDSIQTPEVEVENEFAGKLFLLGQGFGESKCIIENACDCCNSNLLFISSNEFVLNELCEGSEYVTKGNYEVNGDSLTLSFAPLNIHLNYNWEREVDSTAVEFTFSEIRKAIPSTKYKIEKCNGKTLIALRTKKGDELGMLDATSNNAEQIQSLKVKGIWQKLEMK